MVQLHGAGCNTVDTESNNLLETGNSPWVMQGTLTLRCLSTPQTDRRAVTSAEPVSQAVILYPVL